jgi:hypothetical protein
VSSQRQAFERAAYAVEHGVLREYQAVEPTAPNYAELQRVAVERTEEYLTQIEELLDRPVRQGTSGERVARLGRYFDRTIPWRYA